MSVLACGLNTSGQLMEAGPGILCCPSPVCYPAGITAASVAFSHILWRTDSGWHWTGHNIEGLKKDLPLESSWKVCVSEKRVAAIKGDGCVLVWDKRWKAVHFQSRQPQDDELHENIPQDDNCILDEQKNNTMVDSSVKYEEKQSICKGTKRKNSFDDDLPDKINEEKEIVNKKLKDETFVKHEEKWSLADPLRPEKTRKCFAKVAVEDNSLLALDTDGVLYCGSVPVPLKVKVQEVAVGKEHCMAFTAAGDVLTWGSGMRGQLGIGELCQSEKPVPVECLQGVPVTTVACGAWHCVALSGSGDLYVWGWNESGQLGFPYKCEGSQSLFNFFEHSCQCPKSDRLQQATDDHKKREPMQSGQVVRVEGNIDREETPDEQSEGKSKRINPKRSQEVINVQASPVLLEFWTEDVNITQVQCGDRHTLYMLDDGSVWSAGMNRYGQLGLGHTHAVKEPCRVFRRGISSMCAGGWNSLFITDKTHSPT